MSPKPCHKTRSKKVLLQKEAQPNAFLRLLWINLFPSRQLKYDIVVGEENKHIVELEHFNQERAAQSSTVIHVYALVLSGLIILYLPFLNRITKQIKQNDM